VAALKVTPAGSVPDSLKVAAGEPLKVTVKLPALPTVKVALLALVIAGAESMASMTLWLACWPTPFVAVKVNA
jgi:hypothetical protein